MTTFADGLFQYGGMPVGVVAPIPRAAIGGRVYFVDGSNGSDAYNGKSVKRPFATIQAAVTAADAGDTVFVFPKAMAAGATDPGSYEENVVIPATAENLAIIGVSYGRTQGGLPQLKVGTTTTQALLTVRAPGCLIANLGINGSGATGGGILLDDDGSTKTAFGTSIVGCHLKNCAGTTATDAATGGAIQFSGAPWQLLIKGNRFYNNVGDVVLLNTSNSAPKDIVIEDNIFSDDPAASDVNVYLAGGSGVASGLIIRNNVFGALPALTSGALKRFFNLTGCTGMFVGNVVGAVANVTGTELTYTTAGTGGYLPATVFMANNWGQSGTSGEVGYLAHT